jgi:hypothetical protein
MKKTRYLIPLVLTSLAGAAHAAPAPDAPIRAIADNSFLVEEAYNQEAGVVQHILTSDYSVNKFNGPDDRVWELAFTQEWPLFSQTHQIGFTLPYLFVESGGSDVNGLGDVLLNYRWQAFYDEESMTAFAPRLSLVLPTGDEDDGLGDDTLGFEVNLPFSTALDDHWAMHLNAGFTYLPDAGPGPTADLLSYNLGASLVYAVNDRTHLLFECVGGWEEGLTGAGTDREFSAVFSPGVRHAFNYADGSQLVLGVAAPIGLNGNAPDYGLFLYVSFEHGFGSNR